MSELEPCPFCGRNKYLRMHRRKHRDYPEGMYAIKCTRCGIRGRYQLTERRAIDAWNTRERTCHRVTLGLERDREIATVSWICSECHAHMGNANSHCPNCGARVEEDE